METTSILDAVDVWEYREITGAPVRYRKREKRFMGCTIWVQALLKLDLGNSGTLQLPEAPSPKRSRFKHES